MLRYLARDELTALTHKEAFRANDSIGRTLANCKRRIERWRIERRLRDRTWHDQAEPMFKASNIHYDVSERARGLGVGAWGTANADQAWRRPRVPVSWPEVVGLA